MSRRTTALLLISFGVLLGIAVIIWLWWPYHQAAKPVVTPVVQPPAYATSTYVAPAVVNTPVVIPQAQIASDERIAQENLRRQSVDFAARVGTYASADAFAGMKQVYLQTTPEVQTFLEAQRQDLIKTHAVRGPSWGQTARSISSKIISALPLSSQPTAEVLVQLQLSSGAEGQTPVISYKELVIHYAKTAGAYRVDRVRWQEFVP